MNERIRELYKQASKDLDLTDDILDKFAELIVRECAGVVIKEMNYDASECCAKILEHFGVEE